MNLIRTIVFLFLTLLFYPLQFYGQCFSCGQVEQEFISLNSKVEKFQRDNLDSLEYHSNLFSNKFISFIKNNPITIEYKFQALIDSGICIITTSKDGNFRIYSWDDKMGGSMRYFKTIFQFKSGGKIFVKTDHSAEEEDGNQSGFYSQIFTLTSNNLKYYLTVENGIYSSKDASQAISILMIEDSILNDTVNLIKTANGLTNHIRVDYDFFSVVDRPERPLRLIKYDENKKIIYIPIVLENGKVTNRFILYQFKGQYFEKILTQKVAHK